MEIGSLLTMAAALGLGAIVKGATGMGLPLIALPVLTTAFGLQHAMAIMVLPLIATNAMQVWRFRAVRGEARLAFMPWFLLAGAVGIGIGTWLLVQLPERALIFGLGALLILYALLRVTNPHFVVGPQTAARLGPLAGLGAGALQGATGISAPIGVTFIHAMRLTRDAHVFAVSAMFLVFALLQLPALALAGIMRPSWLVEGLLALVPILLFMPLGQKLAGRLSNAAFDRLILIFLVVIGIKMLLGL